MQGPEMIVILAALGVGMFFIHKVFDLAKTFMNRKKNEADEITEELVRDYLAFKKGVEARLLQLEKSGHVSKPLLKDLSSDVEMEEPPKRLKNMLKS